MLSIIPNPLHPAIVHLPMAIVVLLPLVVLGAIWAIRRGARPRTTWGIAAAVHAVLALSAWASLASGDEAGEQVERVIAEAPVETHEEAAEAFLVLAAGATVLSLVGLRSDRIGSIGRGVTAAGTLALVAAGWNVGHSGGQLVYRHGAAQAYVDATQHVPVGSRE